MCNLDTATGIPRIPHILDTHTITAMIMGMVTAMLMAATITACRPITPMLLRLP